ncbi:MAG: acetate--CoA ligase [Thermoflexales bacterium]|nr:acetate--CoA ligase [Thermoflexales bacterium]MCS7324660.1 acetate--CoA ligase [Thermoflexales bacterium]MCX7938592.1 acetate--CoA ligase [Thermoflexales bacterium]MDW8053171.1 acetate--CoA ligase [Anaerolineae bacterium]MDW8291823.1 acetate--CoA ligase [Anaerolineae bacterium]
MTEIATVATQAQQVFHPSPEVVARARIKDWEAMNAQAAADPLGFWAERAAELEWFQRWEKVLDDSNKPFYKWFVGGKFNIVHNALDRHMKTWRKNKVAFIWQGEDFSERTISYGELYREVNRFANVLKSLGVKKGDRVTIYMGRVIELPVAMLACAKIGAVHSVVYGGFSVEALRGRIADSQSKVLVTCDGAFVNGKVVELKRIVDEALAPGDLPVEKVVVYKRTGREIGWMEGRDHWWHELMKDASPVCETEVMDAEDPLFILYTSGSTGKPKALLHTHGGYAVHTYTTLRYVFDIQDEDRYWCAADPGWITGHSYIVYAPLMNGATSIIYEGGPAYPEPDRWWRIVEQYRVTILYCAPTAIRGFMRFGEEWPRKHDLSSLRLLGSVGEPINPEAWLWYYHNIGGGRCPIMDTWWQTETGGFMITPLPVVPLKPGSATRPFFTIKAEVVDDQGNPVKPGEEGYLTITTPWPGMARTIFGDPDRYVQTYWSRYPGRYFTGDSARVDEDGYFWIIGRVDDVIKVSGYRLGTAEVESALVSHPAVAEAAAIGLPHEVRGNAIYTYVILRAGYEGTPELAEELRQHVGKVLGPIARPEKVEFVAKLPKTRSGKIMRRVLKARALGLPEGDLTTLEE